MNTRPMTKMTVIHKIVIIFFICLTSYRGHIGRIQQTRGAAIVVKNFMAQAGTI